LRLAGQKNKFVKISPPMPERGIEKGILIGSKLITMKPFLLLLLLLSLISANAQDKWPTQTWPKTSPEKLNLNADSLAALDRDFAAGKYGNVDGMLIIRHGQNCTSRKPLKKVV
jgi:hypothetical protein